MNWVDVLVAVIAALGGFLGSVISNNKQVAILSTKIDNIKEELEKQGQRIDAHNHLNERLIAVEIRLKGVEERENKDCKAG